MSLFRRGVGASALLLFAHASIAAELGFYFGVNGGEAQYDFDGLAVPTATLLPPGSFPPPIFIPRPPIGTPVSPVTVFSPGTMWLPGDDDSDTAWGAIVGYQITPHFAAELTYLNLGTLEERDRLILISGGSTNFDRQLETAGPSVSVLGMLPLTDAWDVYLRAGVLFADMEVKNRIGVSESETTFGSDAPVWGGGVRFNWGKHWSVRLDYQYVDGLGERFDAGVADIEVITLGILYRL
jgi:opacity protein-like surface antigen